jgi:beta-glucosidase
VPSIHAFVPLIPFRQRYDSPPIFIAENGFCAANENKVPREEAVHDKDRVDYFKGYLGAVHDAVFKDGVNVFGYTAWS